MAYINIEKDGRLVAVFPELGGIKSDIDGVYVSNIENRDMKNPIYTIGSPNTKSYASGFISTSVTLGGDISIDHIGTRYSLAEREGSVRIFIKDNDNLWVETTEEAYEKIKALR